MTTLAHTAVTLAAVLHTSDETIDTLAGGRHWCGAPTVTTYHVANICGTLIAYTRTMCPRHGTLGKVPEGSRTS